MAGKKWRWAEDEVMIKNYPNMRTEDMVSLLDRSVKAISNRAVFLGLKKTKECLSRMAKEAYFRNPDPYKKGQFQKGQKPWNAGLKGLMLSDGSTCFKKGQKPHNTLYDGAVTIRADKDRRYKYIRLAKGQWKLYHRHVWEQLKGPIPEGFIVVFKDGDSMNCNIENLEMISWDENMERNSLHNYPKSLADVIRLTGVMNRLIKKNKDAKKHD